MQRQHGTADVSSGVRRPRMESPSTTYSFLCDLGRGINLSEPHYPDLENGANTFLPGYCEDSHETALYTVQAAPT